MNVRTALGRALLLATTSLGTTAAMADITLYEHARFGGAQVTLSESTADLSGSGFNDKASSAVVTSGRWELCTNSNFRGSCTVLTRGEYPSLQSSLNDRVSSVREGRDRRGNGRADDLRDGRAGDGGRRDVPSRVAPGRGDIGLELYSDAGFGGERVRIERDTSDLSRANFNDRASSAVVTGGTWEICSDARYGGSCATYRPGQYERLGGMSGQASSVRRVR